jgi:hypothetical protein
LEAKQRHHLVPIFYWSLEVGAVEPVMWQRTELGQEVGAVAVVLDT